MDIELQGQGPVIRLARVLRVHAHGYEETSGTRLGDWDVEIPRIKTIVAAESGQIARGPYGWTVPGGRPLDRCSRIGPPDDIAFRDPSRHWSAAEWWSGYQLVDDLGQVSGLLGRAASTTAPAQGTYPVITTGNWLISCLPNAAGDGGEGFLAVSPDGTRYWFSHLGYSPADTLRKALGSAPAPFLRGGQGLTPAAALEDYLHREYAAMLVTRVEDRFGNWVTYQYSGARLQSISASDGRGVTLSHSANETVVAAGRDGAAGVWRYQTATAPHATLRKVVRPDGSSWTFNFQDLSAWRTMVGAVTGNCDSLQAQYETEISGGAGAPSGAQARFVFRYRRSGRSYVPQECWNEISGEPSTEGYALIPNVWYSFGIVSKEIQGAGVAPLTWRYVYSPSNESWTRECVTSACPDTVWTDVVAPSGSRQRTVFSNRFGPIEGKVVATEDYEPHAQAPLSTTRFQYAAVSYGEQWKHPWPEFIGDDFQLRTNELVTRRWVPLQQVEVERDGLRFRRAVTGFDRFARPTSFDRRNSLGQGVQEIVEYIDVPDRWVLGQISRRAVEGMEVDRSTYDPATLLPHQVYYFGKLQQSLGYHADGTLATVTDGRGNTTSLSGWYRGVPRSITHPEGTTRAAVVNDAGWITSVTDENGFETGYGYDVMGRLTGISYPSGDPVAWSARHQEFRALTDSDWRPAGVSAGQWRQVISQGNYRKVTYFDAMWRPVLLHEYDESNVADTLRATSTAYDASGRVAFESYPSSDPVPPAVGIRREYDALGRIRFVRQDSELGSLTTETRYLSGLQTLVIDPRGYQTQSGYVAYDQPGYDLLAWTVAPESRKIVEIGRNLADKPVWVRQRSHDGSQSVTRHYVYDGHMQLCKTIEPETGATSYYYDEAGNLAWSASGIQAPALGDCSHQAAWDSGRWVARQYDVRNRLKHLRFADNNGNQDWTYTPDGLPASIRTWNDGGPTVTVNTYGYNKRRLLESETSGQEGWVNWSMGYGFDTTGSQASLRYPTGSTVTFSPNALGQPTQVRDANDHVWAHGATYHPNGALRRFTYGNGIVHTMQQNTRQLPAQVTGSGGVLDYVYGYDPNGNVAHVYDHARGSDYSRWMAYDSLDRLTDAGSASFGGDHWHRFTYDALDNLRSWKLAGVKDYADYWYNPVNNRLENIRNSAGAAVVGLEYDPQGNLQEQERPPASLRPGQQAARRGRTGELPLRRPWPPGPAVPPGGRIGVGQRPDVRRLQPGRATAVRGEVPGSRAHADVPPRLPRRQSDRHERMEQRDRLAREVPAHRRPGFARGRDRPGRPGHRPHVLGALRRGHRQARLPGHRIHRPRHGCRDRADVYAAALLRPEYR
ncbi:MAG TPA: RHS repeat protein [Lysobacter sp.]